MSSSLQESELIAILNSLGSIAGHSQGSIAGLPHDQQLRVDDDLVNKLKYDRVFVTNKPVQRTYFDDSDIDDDDKGDNDEEKESGVMGGITINKQRIENEWNNMGKYRGADINLSDEDYGSSSSDSDYYPHNRRLSKKKTLKSPIAKKATIKGKKKEIPKVNTKYTDKSTKSSSKKKNDSRTNGHIPSTKMTKKTTTIPAHVSNGNIKHIIPAPSPACAQVDNTPSNSAAFHGSPDCDLDNTTPADEKIRTLKLRLAGHQLTVKNLDAQLNEVMYELSERNKLLNHAWQRIKVLERNNSSIINGKATTNSSYVQSLEECKKENMRLKTQIDLLNSRIDDEMHRRKLSEDRMKAIKEYNEKIKLHSTEVESNNNSLNKNVTELTTKLNKLKKELRDQANEALTHPLTHSPSHSLTHSLTQVTSTKLTLAESDASMKESRDRAEQSESALRNAKITLEHLKEELRLVRIDNHIYMEKYNNLTIENNILREKEATWRMEGRLKVKNLEHRGPSSNYRPPLGMGKPSPVMSTETADSAPPISVTKGIASYKKLYGTDDSSDNDSTRIRERRNRMVNQVIGAERRSFDSDYIQGKTSPAKGSATMHITSISAPASPAREGGGTNMVQFRYERLQKMYEKVTGKQVNKMKWNDDSDSEDER